MRLSWISLAAALCLPLSAEALTVPITLVRVVDGDTVVVTIDSQKRVLRLVEIDAPESGQDFGKVAKQRLIEITRRGQLEAELLGRDRYGRTLARVSNPQGQINYAMVSAGLAWCYPERKPKAACADLQAQARVDRRGLWSAQNPTSPGTWRKDHRRKPRATP